MDSLVQPCYSQLLPVCLRLPSKFSQGHTVTLHLPMEGWNVNLVFSIPRKHASNLPHALLRFWKSQIDIEIIESKFVWKCYPPIQIREPSKDMSKRLEMFFRIFRKSICFRSQLSSLPVSCQDFKKTRKFTCNSSKRKDSGNVTGQNSNNFWWLHDERNLTNEKNEKPTVLEKVIILLWMQRLQRKDKYPGAKYNSIETMGPNLSIRNEICAAKFECEQKDPITSIQVTKEYCNYLNFNCRVSSWPIWIHFKYSTNIQRSVQLFQPKHA